MHLLKKTTLGWQSLLDIYLPKACCVLYSVYIFCLSHVPHTKLRRQQRGRKIKLWLAQWLLTTAPSWDRPADAISDLEVVCRCTLLQEPDNQQRTFSTFISIYLWFHFCVCILLCVPVCVHGVQKLPLGVILQDLGCSGTVSHRSGAHSSGGVGDWPVSCSPALESQVHTWCRQGFCMQDGPTLSRRILQTSFE